MFSKNVLSYETFLSKSGIFKPTFWCLVALSSAEASYMRLVFSFPVVYIVAVCLFKVNRGTCYETFCKFQRP